MTGPRLSIRQAGERLGVTPDTLRYYEREGLLGDLVERDAGGHRRYDERTLTWVGLLLCLRRTGMPLKEVRRFADLARQGAPTVEQRYLLLRRHEAALQEHLDRLHATQEALREKVERYETLLRDASAVADLDATLLPPRRRPAPRA